MAEDIRELPAFARRAGVYRAWYDRSRKCRYTGRGYLCVQFTEKTKAGIHLPRWPTLSNIRSSSNFAIIDDAGFAYLVLGREYGSFR